MADKPDPQASFASLGDAAPAHWVELVRSRAPHLLDGRGSLRSSPVTHQARNETAGAGNPERPKLETAVRPARGQKSVLSEPGDESYRTDEMERSCFQHPSPTARGRKPLRTRFRHDAPEQDAPERERSEPGWVGNLTLETERFPETRPERSASTLLRGLATSLLGRQTLRGLSRPLRFAARKLRGFAAPVSNPAGASGSPGQEPVTLDALSRRPTQETELAQQPFTSPIGVTEERAGFDTHGGVPSERPSADSVPGRGNPKDGRPEGLESRAAGVIPRGSRREAQGRESDGFGAERGRPGAGAQSEAARPTAAQRRSDQHTAEAYGVHDDQAFERRPTSAAADPDQSTERAGYRSWRAAGTVQPSLARSLGAANTRGSLDQSEASRGILIRPEQTSAAESRRDVAAIPIAAPANPRLDRGNITQTTERTGTVDASDDSVAESTVARSFNALSPGRAVFAETLDEGGFPANQLARRRRTSPASKGASAAWPELEAPREAGSDTAAFPSHWPTLPPEDAMPLPSASWRSLALDRREQDRRLRIDLEQRGLPWNA